MILMCVMCVCVLENGNSVDESNLASTLCRYNLRKGYFYLFWAGQACEAGKYLFRAAKLWWRCAQYFVIASCG